MARSTGDSVKDTLENLIEQFSDVYCFYRELIQNSLDAGTNRVDINLEFRPPEETGGKKKVKEERDGVIVINIEDYGEGMNREIIDNQLTRLFSSSKENDLTKIGKFGIGFVSVFAVQPQAVVVDTSRDGEDWRIIFDKDRNFKRIKRDYPVDGTKIQILKSGAEKFFRFFTQKSEETVRFWCKHSEAEIYFQGKKVNEPFDLDSMSKVTKNTAGADLVAGYVSGNTPLFGFYNQGLTLMEGQKEYFPGVAFKLKSRYLEHTLTRDNIREDENYWKAMEILNQVVTEDLPLKLFDSIEKEIMNDTGKPGNYEQLAGFALELINRDEKLPKSAPDKALARDIQGNPMTYRDLLSLKNQGEILYDGGAGDITDALLKKGKKIVTCKANSNLFKILTILSQRFWGKNRVKKAGTNYFMPIITPVSEMSETKRNIARILNQINREMNNKTPSCRFAIFDYKGSCIKDRIYVMQENPGELSAMDELQENGQGNRSLFSLFSRSRTLIINSNHPYIEELMRLGETSPDISAYFLAKLLYMNDGIDTETDSRLAMYAMEQSV